MRLTKIALGVAVGIGGAAAANAADVAMFPYVVSSPSVTTILTIIDRGRTSTGRYDDNGRPSSSGGFLHWRLNHKQAANADNTAAPCDQVSDLYMPTSPGGIISVDVSGHFIDGIPNGVLFDRAHTRDTSYDVPLIKDTTLPTRGVFFAHNSDDHVDILPAGTHDYTRNYEPDEREMLSTYGGTVQGEAMIFEYAGGAAWGYKAELKDSGNNDDPTDFSYTNLASTGITGKPWPLVTFMQLDEVTTKLAIIPVDDRGEGMLDRGGSGALRSPSVKVGLRTGNPLGDDGDNVGVAFNRNGEAIPGAVDVVVNCVGAVTVDELMTSAAHEALIDGGYGLLSIMSEYTDQYMDQDGHAIVYKVEYKDTLESDPNNPYPRNPTFNGQNLGEGFQTFNTGMKL